MVRKTWNLPLAGSLFRNSGRKDRAASKRRGPFRVESLEARVLLAADPIIGEFMARNRETLTDEDGAYSDWIEIYNRGDAAADVSDYYLSNDAATPTKWRIPAGTTLEADEFLIVFASGKDKAVAGSELHTDFELDETGGFVGLFASDGATSVSQYEAYPILGEDQSYGVVRPVGDAAYFGDGSQGRRLIPTDGSLGDTWTGGETAFDDSAWIEGPSGFGYETQPGSSEFVVTCAHSTQLIESLAQADSALSGNSATLTHTTAQVINYFDASGGGGFGNFGGDVQFPGGGGDDFALRATTTLFITPAQAGTWTFGFNSDDGGRLKIDGTNVILDDAEHGTEDRFGTITLAAGPHELELTYFERAGGAEVELFAAPGSHGSFDGNVFDLIGDPAGNLPSASLGDFFQTDLQSEMMGQNASAYIRLPFDVDDPADVQTLQATMNFDDGYAAYLNGQLVGSQNAPEPLTYDGTAVEKTGLATTAIDLTPYRGVLRTGENILAVQGLNASMDDTEFLIQPVVTGRVLQGESIEAFDIPTPGALNGRLDPLITEFQASNQNTIEDEDGGTPDWIEIHNPGQVDVDLAGWHLTDNPTNLDRWQFPTTYLPAGDYLVVFASGKDRAAFASELHTDFKLSAGGEYLALVKPDGITPVWEYEPGGVDYEQQFEDVSYGLAAGGTGGDDGGGDDGGGSGGGGVIAYWDFEDGAGTTLADRTGNGRNGNITGAAWTGNAAVGDWALDFDGADDLVETGLTATALGIAGSNARSVAGWAWADVANGGGVFEIGSGAGQFALHAYDVIGLEDLWTAEYGNTSRTIAGPYPPGWFHFAIVNDGAVAMAYVDGNRVDTRNVPVDTNDDQTFRLGTYAGISFDGVIDDLAVFDTALTDGDVADLASGAKTPLAFVYVEPRQLGTNVDGFTVRQVNASPDFAGVVTGEIGGNAGSGIHPLQDADDLLALSAPDVGIAAEVTFLYDEINFFDTGGGGLNGDFDEDKPFPLDELGADDNHFALQATATLIVEAGEAGEFIVGFSGDDGGRLRIDDADVIVDDALGDLPAQTVAVNMTEGEHSIELTFFERDGGAHVELFYASSTGGVQDEDFQLIAILPSQQLPEVPPNIYQAPRVFFPEPTPGAENNEGVGAFVTATTLSSLGGYYDAPFSLSINNNSPNVEIRYTTDGSTPTATSGTVYSSPLNINSTTVLRAAAFLAGAEPSDVVTASYFFLTDVITQSPGGETPAGFPAAGAVNGHTFNYGIDPEIVGVDPPAADEYPAGFAQFKDAIEQIPTISMVTDSANLFDASTGIYVNQGQHGRAWERPASLELIDPAGALGEQTEFQIDAGVRIRGGASRSPNNPKHAFRLFFRSEYGEAKLDYPLFGDEGVDAFDTVDLRTPQNYSWSYNDGGNEQNTFLRDIFSRDLMRELDQPYTRGRCYHLYINGQYWGVFQTEERPESSYAESYFGGDKDDYDVVKNDPRQIGVTDGAVDAYNRLADRFNQPNGLSDSNMAEYYRVQGMNPDGTRNPDYERLLDVDNLIDYMLVTYFTADSDGPGSRFTNPNINNYFAIFNREDPDGWKFFEHDSEHSLDTSTAVDDNMVSPLITYGSDYSVFNAHWMHQELANGNSNYRQRFADRIYEVFFDDGPFASENATALLDARAAEIDQAIYAESARWGDSKSATPKTIDTWNSAVATARDWVDNRIPVVLEQIRQVGWYPDVSPPEFDPVTGEVARDTSLDMFVPGAEINVDTVLVSGEPGNTTATYWVPTNSSVDNTWFLPGFVDTGWANGPTGIGYERGSGYESLIRTDVDSAFRPSGTGDNTASSIYMRIRFTVDDVDSIDRLVLGMKYDDGYAAYINGHEVAGRNFSAARTFDAYSDNQQDAGSSFEDVDITDEAKQWLSVGENVLAIHGVNTNDTSTDLIFLPQLVSRETTYSQGAGLIRYTTDGTDPRGIDGQPSATAIAYDQPVAISQSGPISARSFVDGQWSPLRTERFLVGATTLAVGEIHYHPAEPTLDERLAGITDADLFEFIEIVNVGGETVDMGGVYFTDGITFDFTGSETVSELAPGERTIVVRNLAAYQIRFGTDVTPAGVYSGFLDNAGERVGLANALDQPIVAFTYEDGGDWPGRADGNGFSLEMVDPFNIPPDEPQRTAYLEDGNNWRSSRDYQGSPGFVGLVPRDDVVVNEVLSNTDAPGLLDAIELFNTSDDDVDVGGWYLSDSRQFAKYRIPDGTVLPAGGYLVFDENDFNPPVPQPDQVPFGLSGSEGDDVWLIEANADDGIIGFVDQVDFGAAVSDESFGRWPNGQGPIVPMLELTLGEYNAGVRVGPIIITEVMYHPAPPTSAELMIEPTLESDDLEFIELFNPTGRTIDVGEWRLDNAVEWVLPAGTVMAPGQVLVAISFDPDAAANTGRFDAFLARYPDVPAGAIIGGWSGRLNNTGESVQLERPEAPVGIPPVAPYVPVDHTRYDDTGHWPLSADGLGDSLARTGIDNSGKLPDSWVAQPTPTPGAVHLVSGRFLFYDSSHFDSGTDLSDDDAIAPDKMPLLSGQPAAVANITNYSAGINGLAIDLFGLSPAVPTTADFQFRTGNVHDTATWSTPDAPATVDVRSGEGVGGADRVVITWPDGAIANTWLEATVLATANTGLPADQVFYFGNAIGDAVNAGNDNLVNAADVIGVRDNPHTAAHLAGITDPFDLNRDGHVDALDMIIARNNAGSPLSALRMITPLAAAQAPGGGGEGEAAAGSSLVNVDVDNPFRSVDSGSGADVSIARVESQSPIPLARYRSFKDVPGWMARRSKVRDWSLSSGEMAVSDGGGLLDGGLLDRLATELAGHVDKIGRRR